MRGSVEIEWQLEGVPLGTVRRWLAAGVPPPFTARRVARVVQRDTYWDTADWRLHRNGVALRTRRKPGRLVATLKETARARRGVSRRREDTVVLDPTTRPGAAALLTVGGPVGARIQQLVGESPGGLVRLFGVVTRRTRVRVCADDAVVAELVLDRTRIVRRGRTRRQLERVEVELPSTARPRTERVASAFVAALRRGTGLRPAARTKFESGLVACRLRPRG